MSDDSKYLAEKLFNVSMVDTRDIKIGETYKFSGRITKFIDDKPPHPVIQINYNIKATLQSCGQEVIDHLKEHVHVTAIFHCKVIAINKDGSLDTECSMIGMGEVQDDSNKS